MTNVVKKYEEYSSKPNNGGWATLSQDERAAKVSKHVSLVRYVANRLAARLPAHVNRDDLYSSGLLGLIDAIDKFEPSRGIMFKTYAEFRVRGAILDELRSLDWVPRSIRKKSNQLERTLQELEGKLGRPPNDEEIAKSLELTRAEYHKLLDEVKTINILDLDAFGFQDGNGHNQRNIHDILADETAYDALKLVGLSEVKNVLAKTIDKLPEKERLIITLYYYEELTMREIGKVLDYTESRISQLHTQCLARLKGRLRSYFSEFK